MVDIKKISESMTCSKVKPGESLDSSPNSDIFFLPAHPAFYMYTLINLVSGMHSFNFSGSHDAMTLHIFL